MGGFLKPSWGNRDKERSEQDQGDQRQDLYPRQPTKGSFLPTLAGRPIPCPIHLEKIHSPLSSDRNPSGIPGLRKRNRGIKSGYRSKVVSSGYFNRSDGDREVSHDTESLFQIGFPFVFPWFACGNSNLGRRLGRLSNQFMTPLLNDTNIFGQSFSYNSLFLIF